MLTHISILIMLCDHCAYKMHLREQSSKHTKMLKMIENVVIFDSKNLKTVFSSNPLDKGQANEEDSSMQEADQ